MINWLNLTDDQRKASLAEAAYLSGIPVKVLEKDWWVTLSLKALFSGQYANLLVFKGGTSLSKCWQLINRFSEDIDIALSPEALGMEYQATPSKTFVVKLKTKGCQFTNTLLKYDLEGQLLALGLRPRTVDIIPADYVGVSHDKDPQTLHVKYRSLYDPDPYFPDEVKIEVGVRSLLDPNSNVNIQSLLNQFNPIPAIGEVPFAVNAVVAHKTFLEKSFLLHEEFSKVDRQKVRSFRMSRHLYDLGNMQDTETEKLALSDHELYNHLINHRRNYSRFSWLDYNTLSRDSISFIPPPDVFEAYRLDYQAMKQGMIYDGDALEFDDLIEKLTLLQGRFRNIPIAAR